MKTANVILLPVTDFGVVASHYDGSQTTITGDAVKAAGYYKKAGGLHTVVVQSADFDGTIKIQATLDTDPVETSWFTTQTITGDGSSLNDDDLETFNSSYNIKGNYTWMRAIISDFTQGSIDVLKVSH